MTTTDDKSAKLVLFEDIEIALQPLMADETIHSIEVFNSQKDFENKERPRNYPFVAIDIATEWSGPTTNNAYKQLGYIINNEQDGNCLVTVHCVFADLDDETTAFKTAEPVRHCVHRYIQEIKNNPYYTPVIRIGDLLDTSHGRVFDLITTYKTDLKELALMLSDTKTGQIDDVDFDRDLIIENEVVRTAKDIS